MGSHWNPNAAWVITPDKLKELLPQEYAEFEVALEKANTSLEEYAKAIEREDGEDEEGAWQAYSELQDIFARHTTVWQDNGVGTHLTLGLGFISWDDVDAAAVTGVVFYVTGVEDLTPPGKKFEKYLTYNMWTEFG